MSAQIAPVLPATVHHGTAILDPTEHRRALQARLRQSSVFHVLSESDLEDVLAVAHYQIHRRGELVHGGDVANNNFYVMLQGVVRCSLLSTDGNKVTLGTLHPGMVFWFALPNAQTIATAYGEVLMDGTELCRLPYRFIRQLMDRNPRFAVEMYDNVYAWCIAFRDRLAELAHDHVIARLAHLLGRLAAGDEQYMVMETHDELAWWIGTSRARVTKELHGLRERGLIDYRPHVRGIHVPDPHRLRTFHD